MVDEFFQYNNPEDVVEDKVVRIEEKVIDIYHKMALLMVDLVKKFKPFGEVGGSNSEFGLDEKLGDSEDVEKELKKYPKKEQPSSITITPSHNLFKMEYFFYVKPY
jgi:hypothetical protein